MKEKERVASPKLKLSGLKKTIEYDDEDDIPNSVASNSSKVVDDNNREKCKCIDKLRKIGDGGVSFREMTNKQFQYDLFMDLQKYFRQIQESQAQILDKLKIIEQSGDVNFDVNVDDIGRDPVNSIEQFDVMENILNTSSNARKCKVTQMRGVGGATPRKTVKNVLNAVMTQEIQSLFSKDGRKGKRKFTSTAHYKCIKDAIVGDKNGYDASSIDGVIGDMLKRAKK
nr:uncharacterized protein LOC105848874 isoform X4 [Hydra vulgaris]XP_047138787.1 uncharacterized protein LOC105848874 isoform X4 [Hydra vulgaris]